MSTSRIGRYRLHDAIASGGMAVVHFGRLAGVAGFSRTVAIKRLHPHLAKDPDLVAMLLDEARLASRIRHPNVVPILDVVVERGEVCLVLEYVEGDALAHLLAKASERGERVPPAIALAIVSGALRGLAAAHGATADDGTPLGLVHRDISPQNILVGVDGVARVIDFGVAKATARMQATQDGQLKGKFAYMAPEQLTVAPLDARTDLYAIGIVLWEALTGARLFGATELAAVLARTTATVAPPSAHAPDVGPAIDRVVLRALSLRPEDRFPSATSMVQALAQAGPIASQDEVSAWVHRIASEDLARRRARVAAIESGATSDGVEGAAPPIASESATEVGTAVARPAEPSPKGRPIGVRGGALVLVGVGAVVLAFAFGTRFSRPGRADATPGAEIPPPSAPPVEATSAAATPADSTRAFSSPSSPLSGSASAAPPASAVRHPKHRPASVPGRSGPSPKASGPPSYCSQRALAFTVGPDGIERPRPECL